MMDQKGFFNGVTDGLAILAQNLKQALEEANGITKPEPQVEETKPDQSQENQNLENNSSHKEN